MENVSFCSNNVIKCIDKLSCLRKVDCEIYIKLRSRNSTDLGINAVAVVITCVEIVFCLVTCVKKKLRLLEFYAHKGEKSLYEMEIVFYQAIALWRDEISD